MKKHLSVNFCLIKAGWLFLLVFLANTFAFAQGNGNQKSYATNQSHTVSSVCVGCRIDNPQNAVGNNETNYSSLKTGLALLGNINQTLEFPSSSLKKITIGVGTGTDQLSVLLLSGATIETMNGNTSNGDSKVIDNNILRIGTEPNKAIIELRPSKPYNKVKITLNTGVISLNGELRIYYVYQSEYHTQCNTALPADPYYYYTFNNNFEEEIRQYHMTSETPVTIENYPFANNQVCQEGLAKKFKLETNTRTTKFEKTISFWADIKDSLHLDVLGTQVFIRPTSIALYQTNHFPSEYDDDDENIFEPVDINLQSFTGLHHYSIQVSSFPPSTADKVECISATSGYGEGNILSCAFTTKGKISLFIDGKPYPESYILFKNNNPQRPEKDNNISLTYNNSKIDELLIYDEALPDEVLKKLPCAYNRPQNCFSGLTGSIAPVAKIMPSEDLFTVSPNPTFGQITLEGNISMADADLFINTTFGKEVFRSKLSSKTFDIPATLPGGVYLLTLQTRDKKIYTRKIILTR
ncbi:T9SS type A sorting domain-containing protein [Chryseobacterium sp. WG14]|uniref:T9SS type A sorting domain-containing protein n=1 Tax=Chryseobacterium sp. WG14 TaxID=2926909 RepID=UPI00211F3CA0|nr:T9SS type A sorting domain-containing protein [Chryseobacterium sp. WG14]MCQ9640358.1 T9SS type A sorting domain-containing protein [Chryseobacterium sp. WG14]